MYVTLLFLHNAHIAHAYQRTMVMRNTAFPASVCLRLDHSCCKNAAQQFDDKVTLGKGFGGPKDSSRKRVHNDIEKLRLKAANAAYCEHVYSHILSMGTKTLFCIRLCCALQMLNW